MKAAIRDPDPVVFLENELLYGTAFDVDDAVMESDFVLPIGKAKIQRAGTDISLVAHSIGVGFAMDRQLRGDFSTHLGLGARKGSFRVKWGRKSEGSWCDVLAGGCYVKHVCAQTSSLSQTQLSLENIKSFFCAKE